MISRFLKSIFCIAMCLTILSKRVHAVELSIAYLENNRYQYDLSAEKMLLIKRKLICVIGTGGERDLALVAEVTQDPKRYLKRRKLKAKLRRIKKQIGKKGLNGNRKRKKRRIALLLKAYRQCKRQELIVPSPTPIDYHYYTATPTTTATIVHDIPDKATPTPSPEAFKSPEPTATPLSKNYNTPTAKPGSQKLTPVPPIFEFTPTQIPKNKNSFNGNPENYISLSEINSRTLHSYPVQIGRIFIRGEITEFPAAYMGETKLLTQADVKSRWDDGSVKHAVLSFIIPQLNPNESLAIHFANQTSGNNDSYLDKVGVLATDFDATSCISNISSEQCSSAREMFEKNHFHYWLKGKVATSFIIADHSYVRSFDLGFDNKRSFRPIFHATFFPSINKTKVRFIGELSNSNNMQDMEYRLKLFTGNTTPTLRYEKGQLYHHAFSRWTKEFWIGEKPDQIAIDHNLPYLIKTKAVPNYDLSKVVSESTISSASLRYQSAQTDLMEKGWWTKSMPTAGGRPEIGPYPSYQVQWLYSGDARLRNIVFKQADLAAAFPMHFREGLTGRSFDYQNSINALGKILSTNARPSLRLFDHNSYMNGQGTDTEDKINFVGQATNQGWYPDGSHQPDPFSLPYMLSGDFWYLEELLFWASWGSFLPSQLSVSWGRGPTGSEGHIIDQLRADAWLFRNRVRAAYLCPDEIPEKNYFLQQIDDTIAAWEGAREITGTSYENTSMYNWGATVVKRGEGSDIGCDRGMWNSGWCGSARAPHPMGAWNMGVGAKVSGVVDPAKTSAIQLPWQHNYMLFALGHAKELGFKTEALLKWSARYSIQQITTQGYNPYLIASYYTPISDTASIKFFRTWAEVLDGFAQTTVNFAVVDFMSQLKDAEHGYPYIALSALSFVSDEAGGAEAWNFIASEALNRGEPYLNENPKWAILPR